MWATGIEAALPANAASNPSVILNSVSCPSAGNCSAVGDYVDSSGNAQGLLLSQSSDTWGTGVEATLPTNAGSDPRVILNSVSCPSAGNCSAVGWYFDSSNKQQGLLLSESSGAWSTGIEATPPANAGVYPQVVLNSVSCPSAGNCSAVGDYVDSSPTRQGLLLSQSSGTWGTGVEATLPTNAASNPNVFLNSVSCSSAGNCSSVGYYDSFASRQGLLLSQNSGTWSTGIEATPPANVASYPQVHLISVSCPSAGNCSAVGDYTDSSGNVQGLLLSQSSGTWGTGVEATLPTNAGSNPKVSLNSVSCPSAGTCGAVGNYDDSSFNAHGLLLGQSSGTWGTGVEPALPTNAGSNSGNLYSVSCPSAGNCGAVGVYTDSSGRVEGLLLGQSSGTWGTGVEAALPTNAGSNPYVFLHSVSCPSAANCSAIGDYTDSSPARQGLLLNETSGPAGPDLSITNSTPAIVVSGNQLTYTITVNNTGGQSASNVTVSDALPANVHFDSMSSGCQRTTSSNPPTKGGTVICSLGSLGGGNSDTVTIVVTATTPGTRADTATVTASSVTQDNDDSATATTTVVGT